MKIFVYITPTHSWGHTEYTHIYIGLSQQYHKLMAVAETGNIYLTTRTGYKNYLEPRKFTKIANFDMEDHVQTAIQRI